MVNKAILLGRVGKQPEMREINETKLATFSLATSRKYKGEETTQWHDCKVWGKLADVVEQYVSKGDLLYVEGEIQYRKHEEKYYTSINVSELKMLGGKKSESAPEPTESKQKEEPKDDLPF